MTRVFRLPLLGVCMLTAVGLARGATDMPANSTSSSSGMSAKSSAKQGMDMPKAMKGQAMQPRGAATAQKHRKSARSAKAEMKPDAKQQIQPEMPSGQKM